MPPVYLDHNATSPLRPGAAQAMIDVLSGPPGNASSVHGHGHRARMIVEQARAEVARLLGARAEEIIFTASGTEANNLAIFGAAGVASPGARRIVTSAIEHPSVLEAVGDLEERGFEVARIAPDRNGVVSEVEVLEAAAPGTALVSLMLANNEVGAIQPVARLARELRRRRVLFHCDAAQGAGKVPIDASDLGADLLSIAAHKFGGPQGVGALFVRSGVVLKRHLRGGGQELNRRPGTENVAGIAGLGAAAREARAGLDAQARRLTGLRDRLESAAARLPGVTVNGAGAPRVPNTSSLACEGASAEALVIALDLEGFAVSAGSACSAGALRESHVLRAMGLRAEARSSIRVSLGPETTAGEIDAFAGALQRVLVRTRAASLAAGAVPR